METMIPEGRVPGLVTVREKKTGKTQNLWPIDAKELLAGEGFELVENGAIEVSRMNANPLRKLGSVPVDEGTVEVTGINGVVMQNVDVGTSADAVAAEKSTEKTAADKAAAAKPAASK